jgi:hypothetical protein
MFITFRINLDDESRHPLSEPAQWSVLISNRRCRMRGLFERATAFTARTKGARKRAGGRPMRKVRLMATTYRPLLENLRPEELLSEAS